MTDWNMSYALVWSVVQDAADFPDVRRAAEALLDALAPGWDFL